MRKSTCAFLFIYVSALLAEVLLACACVYVPLWSRNNGRIRTLRGIWSAIRNTADSPADLATWIALKAILAVLLALAFSPRGAKMAASTAPCLRSIFTSRPAHPRFDTAARVREDEESPLVTPSREAAQFRRERAKKARAHAKLGRWLARRVHELQVAVLGAKVLAVAVVGGLETKRHWSDVPLGFTWLLAGGSFLLTSLQRVALLALLRHWQVVGVQRALGRQTELKAPPLGDLRRPLLEESNGVEPHEAGGASTAGPGPASAVPIGNKVKASDRVAPAAGAKDEGEEDVDLDELLERGRKDAGTILALVKLSSPDTPLLLVAFGAGVAAAYFGAFVPFYLGKVINAASLEADRRVFRSYTLRLLGSAAVSGVFTGMRGGIFSHTMIKLQVRLRTALITALLRNEIGFFDTGRTGEITSRLSSDTNSMADQISLNLNVLLRSIISACLIMGFMFQSSWRLTVVTFTLVPVQLAVSKVYGSLYRRLNKKTLETLAKANSCAEEAISSMTTVRSFAAEAAVVGEYVSWLGKYFVFQNQEAAIYSVYACISTLMPSATTSAVLYYGGLLILEKKLSPGALVSFLLYQQSLTGSFQAIGDVIGGLTSAVGSAEKVFELLDREPKIPPAGSLVPASGSLQGAVELRDVRFRYPGRPEVLVLKGFGLEVAPREVCALVGESGGGKSSIIKLIQRFYVPEQGTVLLDGRDVGDYDQRWLKRNIGLVGQEPVLFARSIRRNILYGLEESSDGPCPSQAEVEDACRQANCLDFIHSLPDGFDTECGEKGVQLSGGQKQRISIARALVRRPRVLLLDEATSALDAESEAAVQDALDRMMADHGHTVLVVAHRLSSVVGADKIVVVSAGRVAEVGTHDELLERTGGIYRRLVQKQLQRTQTAEGPLNAYGTGNADS